MDRESFAGIGSVPDGVTDVALGRRRARAAALLELALPGGAYVYQGDELGLAEVEDLPEELLQDPVWERSGHTRRGRDGCRVPIPWSGTQAPFGFGSADNPPWLPQPEGWAAVTAEAQDGDSASHLNHYRAALAERRRHPALGDGTLTWDDDVPAGVLSFTREPGFRCVVNFGPDPYALPADAEILVASGDTSSGTLGVDEAVWLQL
jgi:alpha-glucosidase